MALLDTPLDTTASPFARTADALIAGGYSPITIMPRDKAPGEWQGDLQTGRWTLQNGWNGYATRKPTSAQIERWKTWPDANAGIVLGTIVGGYQLIAVDFDTDDDNELDMLQSQLPPSRMAKRGARGYTAFYRAPVDTRTKRYMVAAPTPDKPDAKRCVLEILTGNAPRQTVMPPSMHPTGQAYRWMTGEGVVPIHLLPVLSADHFEALEDTLEHIGWNGVVVGPARDRASNPTDNDDPNIWRKTNDVALQRLDSWVGELGLPKLKRHSNGRWEGVAHWRPSGTGQPMMARKPNLSFHVTGIRDLGTDQGYSALDVVQAAFAWDFDNCFNWLRSKIGLARPEEFVITSNKPKLLIRDEHGTLHDQETGEIVGSDHTPAGKDSALAAPAVPDLGEPIWADVDDDEGADAIEHVIAAPLSKKAATVPASVVPKAPQVSDELPDAMTRPPGLLGEMTDWITDTAMMPNRVVSFSVALTVLWTILGIKYASPTASGTHLYTLLLAETGTGKQHALDQGNALLEAAKAGMCVGAGEYMSQTAIISAVTSAPLQMATMDEFGSFLGRINSRKAGVHDLGIKKVFLQLWGANFGFYITPQWAGKSSYKIYCPAFSFYGAATPRSFYEALDGADIENGMINRMLVIKTNRIVEQIDPKLPKNVVPISLATRLEHLFLQENSIGNIDSRLKFDESVSPKCLSWESDALKKRYLDWSNGITRERQTNHQLSPFLGRTAEMGIRIATIQAMGRDNEHKTITDADMSFGMEIAYWSALSMSRQARDYLSESSNQSETQRVMRAIKASKDGIILHSELVRTLRHRMKARDLKEMLGSLLDEGAITRATETPAAGGAARVIYMAV
jgi:hypothetical protein